MANAFTRLVESFKPQTYVEAAREARRDADAAGWEAKRLQESVRELSLFLEDLNWTKLDNWNAEDDGITLLALQENNDKLQALLAINPTIKKAINARVGYIWGRGVKIDCSNASLKSRVMETARNQAILFSDHAYWELEAQLATAGNIWAQRNVRTNEITLVPLNHIGGWVTDADDPTRVNYWLIDYVRTVTNFATGEKTQIQVKYFVPAHDAEKASTRAIDDIPIRREFEMIHLAVNRQKGWILGVPDIMAVMFWTKAWKELYEAGTTFVKAQGKFAAKAVAKSDTGGANAAATLRENPRQDPFTGEVLNYGGTAVATGGLDYQLMGKMTGGVDFRTFDPVGALVAAGLGIPLDVLTATSSAADASLEQTTVNEMQMRQKQWSWFYIALFGGKATVVWPKIKTEPEYRRIQSVEIANATNVLSRPELRQLTLEGFGMDGDPNTLPPITQQPQVAIGIALKKAGVEPAAGTPAATPSSGTGANTPAEAQGVASGVGKLSDGVDSKDARNNPLDTNVKGQK